MKTKGLRTFGVVSICAMLAVWTYQGCTGEVTPYGTGSLTISPDGRLLLFAGGSETERGLYSFDLKTRVVKQILRTRDYVSSPALSPDGKLIAYEYGVSGDHAQHICVSDLATGNVTQLTSADTNDTSPTFVANGSEIVFARDDHYNCCGLSTPWYRGGRPYSIDIHGGHLKRLLPDSIYTHGLKVSPDGRTLLWTSDGSIFTMPISGTGNSFNVAGEYAHDPAFSPDGKRIVFTCGDRVSQVQLCTISIHGGAVQVLTQAGTDCSHPVYSADGKTIYYQRAPYIGSDVCLMQIRSDGTLPRQIAGSDLFEHPMWWRP